MIFDSKQILAPERRLYVAPVRNEAGAKVGERLTLPLPIDARTLRYYEAKGFRLASEEDIARLRASTSGGEVETISPEREKALIEHVRREQSASIGGEKASSKPASHHTPTKRRSR